MVCKMEPFDEEQDILQMRHFLYMLNVSTTEVCTDFFRKFYQQNLENFGKFWIFKKNFSRFFRNLQKKFSEICKKKIWFFRKIFRNFLETSENFSRYFTNLSSYFCRFFLASKIEIDQNRVYPKFGYIRADL